MRAPPALLLVPPPPPLSPEGDIRRFRLSTRKAACPCPCPCPSRTVTPLSAATVVPGQLGSRNAALSDAPYFNTLNSRMLLLRGKAVRSAGQAPSCSSGLPPPANSADTATTSPPPARRETQLCIAPRVPLAPIE